MAKRLGMEVLMRSMFFAIVAAGIALTAPHAQALSPNDLSDSQKEGLQMCKTEQRAKFNAETNLVMQPVGDERYDVWADTVWFGAGWDSRGNPLCLTFAVHGIAEEHGTTARIWYGWDASHLPWSSQQGYLYVSKFIWSIASFTRPGELYFDVPANHTRLRFTLQGDGTIRESEEGRPGADSFEGVLLPVPVKDLLPAGVWELLRKGVSPTP